MGGLGKQRSKFGRFIDEHGLKQERIREISKVSRETITRACRSDAYKPIASIQEALAATLRKLTGKNVTPNDFWT